MSKLNQKQIQTLQHEVNEKIKTKSEVIRFLHQKEYSRSEIAKILDIRYQHVRNVLITPLTSKK